MCDDASLSFEVSIQFYIIIIYISFSSNSGDDGSSIIVKLHLKPFYINFDIHLLWTHTG